MMIPTAETRCVAFAGVERLATGRPRDVIAAVKAAADAGRIVLIFDLVSGRTVEFDLRGDLAAATARLPEAEPARKGPGRPKLGVTAREVTLLPRHWDWLSGQPGGASVSLRKLVEAAMREAEGPDRVRAAREAAYRFMTAMAGDLPNYEAATRWLFAGDWTAFDAAVADWPEGVRETAQALAEGSWRNGVAA
jgi:uncharacterized protein